METTALQTRLSPQIQELELEQFVLQLEDRLGDHLYSYQ